MGSVKILIFVVIFAVAMDCGLMCLGEEYILDGYVYMNDFEVTQKDHRGEAFDKVFFGNSSVIAAYREEESQSGYINLGIDYGVITDLWEMIDKGYMRPTEELVIGFDYLTLYDRLDTNPSYIWHRGLLEPYAYFQRDDLYNMLGDAVRRLRGVNVVPLYTEQTKIFYHGMLSTQELKEKVSYYEENYFNLPYEDFSENFEALSRISAWCEDNGVRLRIVSMPWNPGVEKPSLMLDIKARVQSFCSENGIGFLDLSDEFDAGCFYDVWHINYEYGSHIFTERIDQWLTE